MNDMEQDNGTPEPPGWRKPAIVILILVMLYCFSFGPFLFVAVRFFPRSEPAERIMKSVFRPHLVLMYHSRAYWAYLNLWVRLGGVGTWSHEKSREWYEQEGL